MAADAPGGPKIEEGLAGGKYFQFSHPVTNEIEAHTGFPMAEGSARNVSKKLYEGATALEKIIPDALLDLLAHYSTDAYVVSAILGNDTDKECEALSNGLAALLESIRKTHGKEIEALVKAMRDLARKSSGIYLDNPTTDGKSRK